MATLVHQCPHCMADQMALRAVAQSYAPRDGRRFDNYVHLTCPNCGRPSAARVDDGKGSHLADLGLFAIGAQNMGWHIAEFWPEVPRPKLPEHLPDPVARAYLQAERSFGMPGMEESSAGSYGRALDVGTKLLASDLAEAALYARIEKLANLGRITPELKAWAHEIRLIRNYALHEIDSVARDELAAMRGATELLLTYLFTLPGMLRERQSLIDGKPKG